MDKILIKFVIFINFNSASNGGAISRSSDNDVSISMAVFENCRAAESGGAIFVDGIKMSFNTLCLVVLQNRVLQS